MGVDGRVRLAAERMFARYNAVEEGTVPEPQK
jgi:hypothetical protein